MEALHKSAHPPVERPSRGDEDPYTAQNFRSCCLERVEPRMTQSTDIIHSSTERGLTTMSPTTEQVFVNGKIFTARNEEEFVSAFARTERACWVASV